MCENSIVYETDRIDEFAPIKNADTPEGQPPASDSPASSKRIQVERAGRWLEANQVTVPRNAEGEVDATLEISQRTAIYPQDLAQTKLPDEVKPGQEVLL